MQELQKRDIEGKDKMICWRLLLQQNDRPNLYRYVSLTHQRILERKVLSREWCPRRCWRKRIRLIVTDFSTLGGRSAGKFERTARVKEDDIASTYMSGGRRRIGVVMMSSNQARPNEASSLVPIIKMSSNPTDTPIAADDKMDIDTADQNENTNVTKGGKGKHGGKLSDPNMAKLILSRKKVHKSGKHKKRTEVTPATASPLAHEINVHHYKHTTYECGHEIWEDKEGNYLARWELPDKFTTTKFVDRGNCGCAMYYVPRGSHLFYAEIAAEQVLRAAKPGDSFEEVFREADMAAFCVAPKDHYHEGPLGGWGPAAGWNLEIPERDMPSNTSRAPQEESPTNTLNDVSLPIVLFDRPSTNALSMESPSKSLFQTAAPAPSPHREVIDLTSESEEDPRAGPRKHRMVDSTRSSRSDSGQHFGVPQETSGPETVHYTHPSAPLDPLAMVVPDSRAITLVPLPSDTPSSATISGTSTAAASPFSRAPVAASTGGGPASATRGLTLVVNGVTYPRIENGKERWYTQRPGRNNNYSRYSDLAKFDASKGIRVAPKASKAQLEAARRYRTFG
ncbi:hypothetical protein KCU65_g327, partial [Aureobasidium melanogenum]